MKELTRAEEQIMQILWEKKEGFIGDILEEFSDPRPAYNTVSTITRILVKKGFVGFRSMGKSHLYYPLISREEYKRSSLRRLVKNYFGNSYREMVSFFAREENFSLDELEEIRQVMKQEIKKQKSR